MQMVTSFPGGARVETAFGPYVVRTDQPPHGGGEGSAPTPFATFLASIGACAGAFLVAFCRSRGLATEEIQIVQSIEGERTTGMVTAIHLDIHLPPGFPEKYRDPLVRAVEQCTIKKHLDAPPRIVTTTRVDVRKAG